jgi:opacity protein-like surface antigen
MKKIPVILVVALGFAFAGVAEAATPKKRTRNANRVGPYGAALLGYSNYTGDQSESELELIDILTDTGAPFQNMTSSTENTDFGYQATFGYRFTRYFAAELALAQFGELKSTAKADMDFGQGFVPTSVSLSFATGGVLISAVGILPFNDKFEMYGRLGYLLTSSERELSSRVDGQSGGFGSADGDSQDLVYGIGFAWHINQIYSIRSEFQQLDQIGQENRTGTEDLTVIGVGLIVRF